MAKRKDVTAPHEALRPGRDPTEAIAALYGEGRTYPRGRPHEVPRHSAKPAADHDNRLPQDPEDQRGPNYENDAGGWVRGMSNKAPHPFFDSGPSGTRYGK